MPPWKGGELPSVMPPWKGGELPSVMPPWKGGELPSVMPPWGGGHHEAMRPHEIDERPPAAPHTAPPQSRPIRGGQGGRRRPKVGSHGAGGGEGERHLPRRTGKRIPSSKRRGRRRGGDWRGEGGGAAGGGMRAESSGSEETKSDIWGGGVECRDRVCEPNYSDPYPNPNRAVANLEARPNPHSSPSRTSPAQTLLRDPQPDFNLDTHPHPP
eukprot:scaffold5870_cov93-Isochrysis_galbana.AAC.1